MALLLAILATAAGLSPAAPPGERTTVRARGSYCDPATGCTGGTAFYANTAAALLRIDLAAGSPRAVVVGELGTQMTDIALASDGTLYGVSFRELYTIDQSTGRARLVGPLGVQDVNGLVAVGTSLLASSTDGFLYEVDRQSGRTRLVGSFGAGISSSGDLCFGPGGALYMTSPEGPAEAPRDRLVRVDPRSGTAAVVGPTGLGRLYGLAWVDGSLVGVTESGAVARLDLQTGAATVIDVLGVPFWGAS